MVETTSSFEEWLNWEAFLACKHRQASYPVLRGRGQAHLQQ